MSKSVTISLIVDASVSDAISNIKNLQSNLSILRDQTTSASEKFIKLGKNAEISANALKVVTTQTTNLIAALAKPAIAFESAMAEIKRVVQFDSPKQFKEMEQDLLKLTRILPVTQKEIASLVAQGGGDGIAREQLLNYAESVVKLGVAFKKNANEVGKAMITLSNVLGKPITEIGQLGDAINYLADQTTSDASDIVDVLTQISMEAKLLGLTENQIASLSSTLLTLGKSSTDTSQIIKQMSVGFSRLKAGEHAQALQKLGLSAESFAQAMNNNAQEAISGFINKIGQLPDAEQFEILTNIFGSQQASNMMLLSKNSEQYANQLALLEKVDGNGHLHYIGSIQREFAATTDTTENNIHTLQKSFDELGTAIGTRLLPSINLFIDKLIPVIHSMTDWVNANPQVIDQILQIGFVLVGVVETFLVLKTVIATSSMLLLSFWSAGQKVVTLLQKLGKFTHFIGGKLTQGFIRAFTKSTILAKQFSASFIRNMFKVGRGIRALAGILSGQLVKAAAIAMRAFLFLGRALLTNPIGLLITGIAVAAYLIYRYWEPIKGFFLQLWEGIKGIFASACQFVSTLWNSVQEIWSAVWDGISSWFNGFWESLQGLFDGNFSELGNTILAFSPLSLFKSIFESVLNYFGIDLPTEFTNLGKNIIDGLVNGISNAWNSAKETVSELGTSVKNWFAEKLSINSPSRVFMGFGENTVQGLVIGIDKSTHLVERASDELASAVSISPEKQYQSLRSSFAQKQAELAQNNTMAIHFNPIINVSPSSQALNDIKDGLKMSLTEFEKMLERVMEQRTRRAY
ncbi:phage tail tape measure protein [Pasteurella oralis]|uniref:Phage tail tape measure protein n=1 Tax=Pasteurella oralis TaxID=1071947 RepID=A0ABW4NV44_9PAST